jgi:hypothetical protein
MNLTDLTTELQARAETPQPSAAMARLIGVRRRVRARRRRQAASAAGLVAFCVAAVFLAPGVSSLRADRTPDPATTDTPGPTPTPSQFAGELGKDPLIASAFGRPGETELVLRFTPTDTNLAISSFCRLEQPAPSGSANLMIDTTVNGHPLSGTNCTDSARPNSSLVSMGKDVKANRRAWAADGVRAGKQSVLRVRVVLKNQKVLPGLRLGTGIYQQSGPRVVSDGVTLEQYVSNGGRRYVLQKYRTMKATATKRTLSLTTPEQTKTGLVVTGNPNGPDGGHLKGEIVLLVDGEEVMLSEGDVTTDHLLDDTDGHTLELRLSRDLRGTMLIAYYVAVD